MVSRALVMIAAGLVVGALSCGSDDDTDTPVPLVPSAGSGGDGGSAGDATAGSTGSGASGGTGDVGGAGGSGGAGGGAPVCGTWHRDCDGDGAAASGAENMYACGEPDRTDECNGWTLTAPDGAAADCDDVNPLKFPTNVEMCNMTDDNCNNMVDEGNACSMD